jgi:predicted transcriptional regulator
LCLLGWVSYARDEQKEKSVDYWTAVQSVRRVGAMNDELLVLNALLRLARRRTPASIPELDARVGSTARRVRVALSRLSAAGLVQRLPTGATQLTLQGFALAVALARRTAFRRPVPRAARRAA